MARVLVISLWLHLTLLLLMIVTVPRERPEEELPPPSTVAMVFEGGQPQGPALPNPQPNVTAPTPPPAPAPTPPVAVARPPAPQAAEVSPPPAPPVTVEPAPLPVPPPPVPPPPAPAAEVPVPKPPPLAMVIPRPAPPVSRPAPRPEAAPTKPQAFPTPMNFSFNPSVQPPRPAARNSSRAPSTLDFSMAPRQGATDTTPFSQVSGARVGPDWRNELSAWVRAHAYYPEQAAMNGEDGSAMVQVVANPNGKVTSVALVGRSGSKWLDMALVALFRDASLPPLLGENEPITFNFTMHYILIRGP